MTIQVTHATIIYGIISLVDFFNEQTIKISHVLTKYTDSFFSSFTWNAQYRLKCCMRILQQQKNHVFQKAKWNTSHKLTIQFYCSSRKKVTEIDNSEMEKKIDSPVEKQHSNFSNEYVPRREKKILEINSIKNSISSMITSNKQNWITINVTLRMIDSLFRIT